MHSFNIWHKFDIYRYQIVLILLVTCFGVKSTQAQVNGTLNLPNFDEQRIHYGFLMGLHSSRYRSTYADDFTEPQFDSLHSVIPRSNMGFKVGFIFDYHIVELIDVRASLTVGFNQYQMDYRFSNGSTITDLRDPTYVELPILLKFKSVRRFNRRMYFLGGINPMFKAVSSKEREDPRERLLTRNFNLALDMGMGMDLYQPLFKFSPEIRYSFGLLNALDKKENTFSAPLNSLATHTIAFYITFEGAPSSFQKKAKKQKRKRR